MRILRLNAYYLPEKTAGLHLMLDLNTAFETNKINYSIITPVPTRGISDSVRKQYKKIPIEYTNNGFVEVNRFHLFKEYRNPLLRIIRYIFLNIKEYKIAVKQKNIDIVFCSSTPPTQGMMGALVSKKLSRKYKKTIPFVYNLQDVFPDSLVNARMTKKGSLIWKIGRKIENFTYKNADKIIVISEDFKQNIMKKGVPEEKIVVIPNWVNMDNVYSVDRKDNVLFDRYNLDRNKFYICYSGNLGHSQNFELLIAVAEEIQISMPDVVFVLIGEGAAKKELELLVQKKKLKNVVILPFQPYEDIAHVFSFGDVGLIISKPGIGESSVPSKTWGIMAAKRPILASFDKKSALVKLIENTHSGICADAANSIEFINAIKKFRENSAYQSLGENGYTFVHTYLDKDKCVNMYIDVLKSFVGD